MNANYWQLEATMPLKPPRIKRQLPASSYWAIAQEVVRTTGIRKGNCLEIGGGNGFFGIAMAQITDMAVHLMANSEIIINHLAFDLKRRGMENHITLIKGTLHQIPVNDQTINLVVCRKSIFFWHNQLQAFQEIYRILAPGGAAYIGDDSWNEEKWRSVENKLAECKPQVVKQLNGNVWRQRLAEVKQRIIQAGVASCEMNCTDEGLRVIIRRPA